jgi:hypothetical protein
MPTGYTNELYKGEQSFRDFVLTCARAFGAAIHMRDEALEPTLRPQEIEPYYAERLEASKRRLEELNALTPEQALARSNAEFEEEIASSNKYAAELAGQNARYMAMLQKVMYWEPPTADHRELKNFMIDQLKKSVEWDCRSTSPSERSKKSGTEWLRGAKDRASQDVEYYQSAIKKEVERVEKANQWIAELLKAL